jgi:hypothetical protein
VKKVPEPNHLSTGRKTNQVDQTPPMFPKRKEKRTTIIKVTPMS